MGPFWYVKLLRKCAESDNHFFWPSIARSSDQAKNKQYPSNVKVKLGVVRTHIC